MPCDIKVCIIVQRNIASIWIIHWVKPIRSLKYNIHVRGVHHEHYYLWLQISNDTLLLIPWPQSLCVPNQLPYLSMSYIPKIDFYCLPNSSLSCVLQITQFVTQMICLVWTVNLPNVLPWGQTLAIEHRHFCTREKIDLQVVLSEIHIKHKCGEIFSAITSVTRCAFTMGFRDIVYIGRIPRYSCAKTAIPRVYRHILIITSVPTSVSQLNYSETGHDLFRW